MGNPVDYIMALIDAAVVTYIQQAFGGVSAWLSSQMQTLISLAIIAYGIAWIYKLTPNKAHELFQFFIKATVIIYITTHWSHYSILVGLFTEVPNEIAGSAMGSLGGNDPTTMNTLLGDYLDRGLDATAFAFQTSSWGSGIIIGVVLLVSTIVGVMGLLVIIILSKIMLSVLLGFGPIFIFMALFGFTGRMFDTWIQQTLNYAILPMFAYGVAMVTLPIAIDVINTPDVWTMLKQSLVVMILAFINWVALKQVAQMTAGIAGGFSLGDEYRARRNAYDMGKRFGAGAASLGGGVMSRIPQGTIRK